MAAKVRTYIEGTKPEPAPWNISNGASGCLAPVLEPLGPQTCGASSRPSAGPGAARGRRSAQQAATIERSTSWRIAVAIRALKRRVDALGRGRLSA